MKKYLTILLLFVFGTYINAQISGTLSNDKEGPIAFANIWIKGTMNGTISDEKGQFSLDAQIGDTLVCDMLGYEISESLIDKPVLNIILKAVDYDLPTVEISPPKGKRFKKWGKYKKYKSNLGFDCSQYGWKVATYVPYESQFKETPFINALKIATRSRIDSAKFKVTFCAVGEDNMPASILHTKPIFGYASKSKHSIKNTKIDVASQMVKIPEEGLYIVLEWLLIPENYAVKEITYTNEEKEVVTTLYKSYEPKFNALPSDENRIVYTFSKANNKWMEKEMESSIDYINKNNRLAIELTLSD